MRIPPHDLIVGMRGFASRRPHLTGGRIRDGYTRHSLAVRVDGKATGNRDATQAWGGEDIRFKPRWDAISVLSSGDCFTVAVQWYGQGSFAFVWSLRGSSAYSGVVVDRR